MDRRKFFKSLARGGIFSVLAGTSVYLLTKEKTLNAKGCDFDFICQDCIKKRHCQLPTASQFRLLNLTTR